MAAAFVTVAQSATTAPLNPAYKEDEFAFYLEDLKARAIIIEAGYDGPARAAADRYNMTVVYVFRAKRADRLKLIYWDGSGLVMAYKRLEDNSFKWPAIKNGVMNRSGFVGDHQLK